MNRPINGLLSATVWTVILVASGQMAEAAWYLNIARPFDSENCPAYGGLFVIQGEACEWSSGVTKVEVYRDATKMGDAAITYRVEDLTECAWMFPWTNVTSGSATIKVIAYSSGAGSSTASVTASFYVSDNTAPFALPVQAHIGVNQTNGSISTFYNDKDSDQFWTARPVSDPLHGTVSKAQGSTTLYYTPSNGYSGLDSFSYAIGDGVTDSPPTTCKVLVHAPANPCGAMVLLVVNSNLFVSAFSNGIMRLKSDLEAENYTATVKLWPPGETSASNVWSFLHDSYTNAGHFLVGAILIGDIPKPFAGGYFNELIYWNMMQFQSASSYVDKRHIWVSRMNVESTTWGSEAALITRALDANHAYRRGESRLPFTAYKYRIPEKWPLLPNSYLDSVWPAVEQRGAVETNLSFLPERTDLGRIDGADCMVKGGEFFEETSHGNSSGYMSTNSSSGNAWVTKEVIHRNLVQTRVCLIGSCSSGAYGGIVNEHLYTRGGGCVLAIGATADSWQGPISGDAVFLGLLVAGWSWGDALVQNLAIGNCEYASLFGDLSLRPMASVYSNAMPVISGFAANSTNTSVGLAVNFSVAASDPDGTISNIEWFLTGFDGGRATPTISGTATNVAYVYGTPGTYTARVEAVDNYQARVWRERVVTVSTAVPYTVTVTKSGNGWSSFGALSPATRTVSPGDSTQIVFTAADWNRIQSLTTDNVPVPAAVGTKVCTQVFAGVAGNINNHVLFEPATPAQTGYTNVPTSWLTNWAENAIIADPAFSVEEKYLIGLDPTTSNTVSLAIDSFHIAGSNVVTALKREHTGGLSPDGMHGQLVLQATDHIESSFTNIPSTAATGEKVFDENARKIITNAFEGAVRYIRAVIQ